MLGNMKMFRVGRLKRHFIRQSETISRGMSTNEIRRNFIKFFENHDHIHVPSSSLLPATDDGSLLFTNAGMNQFKSLFLGSKDNRLAFLKRATSYQKCLRAGGKHNDLENVGYDLHHQTFFEMLGNWSFNNAYSKEDACKLAWYFLTEILNIDPTRLYVSYFGGSKKWNLEADNECREIWLKIGVPKSHILSFEKDNFWEMGPTGPCGPSTEIFYDRVSGRHDVAHLINTDDSIVELWNIVFISLNRTSSGALESLPGNHIDTGMGLERLASVVQNVPSNFDIDAFAPIMKRISVLSKSGAYGDHVGAANTNERDASYRIIADHLRGIVVALADGVVPSAVDSGFIIRKMLRRSFWHVVNRLGADRYACCELVPVIIDTLSPAYPELASCEEGVSKCVMEEEQQYWKIIDKGSSIFQSMCLYMSPNEKIFPGEKAWFLHDTHGIPIEITEDLSKKRGLSVDIHKFQKLKEDAKMLSKSTSQLPGGLTIDTTGLEKYSDKAKYEYSLGADGSYSFPQVVTKVVAVFSKAERVPSLSSHVLNTSSIVDFAVMSDRSSAKGVRRILAVTGEKARGNRRYGQEVLSRLESVIENIDSEEPMNHTNEEKIDWSRIPYVEQPRCRELQKSIKKKRKVKNAVVAT
ncbi:Alanine--tRNA ligase [Trichostrongylus colubriformis]|uniref:alanine--tRNA ligase n=1 Tax=Trichostrongylus colubriformis TaxID=6319 RepID=A0AAN8FNK9_TRICO